MSYVFDISSKVSDVFPGVVSDLEQLIEIPSISSMASHDKDVENCAQTIAGLLADVGCADLTVVTEFGKPAIIARFPAPVGKPTVCFYSHYDVQPASEKQGAWTVAPFKASRDGDRLYGRGSADDKAGVAAHLGMLRVFDGKPPVGVTLFLEGEEEIGSPTLAKVIESRRDLLQADMYVIADSLNWKAGSPAFTTTLRGITDCVIEVETLAHPLHSGNFGGAAPDALTCLVKLLATLVDDAGAVQISGLTQAPDPQVDYSAEQFQSEAQLLDGVQTAGSGSLAARMWSRPAVTVLAIDSPSIEEASNTLAAKARAKVSLRVAPGDDAASAQQALVAHLEAHAPLGARVTIVSGDSGNPSIINMDTPLAKRAIECWRQAWGKEPVFIGCGGSIPMISDFQQAFPDATVVVTAVADPDSRMHAVDESVFLPDVEASIAAEAGLLVALAQ